MADRLWLLISASGVKAGTIGVKLEEKTYRVAFSEEVVAYSFPYFRSIENLLFLGPMLWYIAQKSRGDLSLLVREEKNFALARCNAAVTLLRKLLYLDQSCTDMDRLAIL